MKCMEETIAKKKRKVIHKVTASLDDPRFLTENARIVCNFKSLSLFR